MDFLNKLGLISFILTIIALYLLGIPNKWCFVVFAVSMVTQGWIFWKTKQWWLFVEMIVLLVFNVINFIRWTSVGVG